MNIDDIQAWLNDLVSTQAAADSVHPWASMGIDRATITRKFMGFMGIGFVRGWQIDLMTSVGPSEDERASIEYARFYFDRRKRLTRYEIGTPVCGDQMRVTGRRSCWCCRDVRPRPTVDETLEALADAVHVRTGRDDAGSAAVAETAIELLEVDESPEWFRPQQKVHNSMN
jgi:hypothetical protein